MFKTKKKKILLWETVEVKDIKDIPLNYCYSPSTSEEYNWVYMENPKEISEEELNNYCSEQTIALFESLGGKEELILNNQMPEKLISISPGNKIKITRTFQYFK